MARFLGKKKIGVKYLSQVMRKSAFCICKNKDADQLHGNRQADQRLCYRYRDKENPSLVFSGDREIPTRGSTVPVGNEASPRVGNSRFHCTPMINSISHISNKE